jgi:nucleoside-diphosphate-sugar epimerase
VTPSYTNHVHLQDAARALQHLLLLREPARTYLVVDSEPVDRGEFLAWLAAQVGGPCPLRAAPGNDTRAARSNKRCSNQRLLTSGFDLLYPTFREGWQALLTEEPLTAPPLAGGRADFP